MTGEAEPPPPAPCSSPDAVVAEWGRRVEAEYRSAAFAHQVTLWLIQAGAPPDLIRDGLRVVGDELTHSELSWKVAVAAGAVRPPLVDAVSLRLPDAGDPASSLAISVARYFCIGETVAVPLFRLLRRHARTPQSQRALDAILRDEGRHRQFGWDALDWLLSVRGDFADAVGAGLPTMITEIREAYGDHGNAGPLPPEIQRWGLASPSEYADVLEEALEREVLPRFATRGISPSAA